MFLSSGTAVQIPGRETFQSILILIISCYCSNAFKVTESYPFCGNIMMPDLLYELKKVINQF